MRRWSFREGRWAMTVTQLFLGAVLLMALLPHLLEIYGVIGKITGRDFSW